MWNLKMFGLSFNTVSKPFKAMRQPDRLRKKRICYPSSQIRLMQKFSRLALTCSSEFDARFLEQVLVARLVCSSQEGTAAVRPRLSLRP